MQQAWHSDALQGRKSHQGSHTKLQGQRHHPSESGVMCSNKCGRVDCEDEYIEVSCRTFAERFKKDMKVPSPIHDHYNTISYAISIDNFSIVGIEGQNIAKSVNKVILIRVKDPFLNRNIG